MAGSDVYLLCFAIGFLWSMASLLMGSFRVHGHAMHGHSHVIHTGHGSHGGHAHVSHGGSHAQANAGGFFDHLLNVNSLAIFLAWFGGCGYLLTRHTGFAFWAALFASALVGFAGAVVLAAFLRFLYRHERVLDPFDYDMVGVLGHVSCVIRPSGTGEILFARDSARKLACARSDDGREIPRGAEVIVTRYEKGIAYVRTWDAMTSGPVAESKFSGGGEEAPPALQ
jgi:membrane protein implicated in regulation of membrane protease activity